MVSICVLDTIVSIFNKVELNHTNFPWRQLSPLVNFHLTGSSLRVPNCIFLRLSFFTHNTQDSVLPVGQFSSQYIDRPIAPSFPTPPPPPLPTPPPPPPPPPVPQLPEHQLAMSILVTVCGRLGVPMAPYKRDDPTTFLIFLGIEIDTVAGELRRPAEKGISIGILSWRTGLQ